MENPYEQMDDLGVYTPIFGNTYVFILTFFWGGKGRFEHFDVLKFGFETFGVTFRHAENVEAMPKGTRFVAQPSERQTRIWTGCSLQGGPRHQRYNGLLHPYRSGYDL